MDKEIKPLVGKKKTPVSEDLSNFESYAGWKSLKTSKVIPDGAYFVVGSLEGRNAKLKSDIKPNIFVQGYRPHSSDELFLGDKRRYSQIFIGFPVPKVKKEEDLFLVSGNLYKAISEAEFELIFLDGEWLIRKNVEELFAKICEEMSLMVLSKCKRFWLTPHESKGYFLKGRCYPVLSLLVGVTAPMAGLSKKVLALDLNSGIPGLLDYFPDDFRKMPKERGSIIDERFVVEGDNLSRVK